MSAQRVRTTLEEYMEALAARGDYGRYFADDMEFAIMGTNQQSRGARAAEDAIRYLHEIAFDGRPEVANLLADDRGGALEAVFVGSHIGEFAGVGATGKQVRVPYSVFYDVDADKITALRIYMAMDQLLAQIGQSS